MASYTDLCYGYNAFWAETSCRDLDLDGDGFEIETMMNVRALRAGFKVAEVPASRLSGSTASRAAGIPDGWRVLKTILRERFAAPFPAAAADHPIRRERWLTAESFVDGAYSEES